MLIITHFCFLSKRNILERVAKLDCWTLESKPDQGVAPFISWIVIDRKDRIMTKMNLTYTN